MTNINDEEHLRLLSVFHYVVGGVAALFSFFPIFHLIIGLVFILAPENLGGNGEAPPPFIGWMFVLFSVAFITVGLIFSAGIVFAGRSLAKRKRYLYCLVAAGVECMFMPLGTVLGVFTIIVLMRNSVKELFGANNRSDDGVTM